MNTTTMKVFVQVARLGSFAEAARQLRVSTTAVSRHIRQLEDHLGARLLHRTTRRVSLTPAGAAALARISTILDDIDALSAAVGGTDTPRGHLRVTAGVSMVTDRLQELLHAFLAAHPAVSLSLLLTDHHVDLVAERIDLAIRVGRMVDSGLVARRLGTVRHHLCASPGFLAQHGPITPERLASLPRIIDTNQPQQWLLSGPDGQSLSVPAAGRFSVNHAHAAGSACRAGLGIALLPGFVSDPDINAGTLAHAIPGWEGPPLFLQAAYLERRHLSAAVRALLDHLAAAFSGIGAPEG